MIANDHRRRYREGEQDKCGAGVIVRRESGVADELLVSAVVAIAELRAADADDGDLVLHGRE